MRRFLFLSLLLSSLNYIACKKDKDDNRSECQKNNYGVYKVNFSSTTLRHHVIIGVGFGVREKDLEVGVLSDTFHLAPGIYSVFLTSNNGGPAIDTKMTSTTITQCQESIESVPF